MAQSRADLGVGYGLKRLVLGRPLATARLEHERLGRPTALAVFSSDNMSSVAYATEEILRVLIPAVGLTAFALVLPISTAIVLVEAILIFSYRQTIKAYPTAGGAYIVTKDNLGLLPAQLAGVALLVDYVLTVSVSTAAGVQAISSVVDLNVETRVILSLVFVWAIAYANLLGVRESGRIFSVPTYVFIVSLGLTCILGIVEVLTGHLQPFSVPQQEAAGGLTIGTSAIALFVVLRAFASGGAAVTGVEAISNGVPAFRRPEWRNAQITLAYMGVILGTTFLAVSFLAHRLQVIPVEDESKSVLAQIGQAVYGNGPVGHALFLLLQVSTTLILILAANTSFADFPRLASFHAGDAFMPRQLTKRGHRLVFSNGIVALAAAASLIIIIFRASVTNMIPLYALGVFTSFTLSQTGMARRHLRLREKGWRTGLLINGIGAVCTFVVAIIIAIVKFAEGAWIVMLFVPILVAVLVRVNRTYEAEQEGLHLQGDAATASTGGHTAIVLVSTLDQPTLDALRYAYTIRPDRIRAVYLDGEGRAFDQLRAAWRNAGVRAPLEAFDHDGALGDRVAALIRARGLSEDPVTLLVPGPRRDSLGERIQNRRHLSAITEAVRSLPNVSIVVPRGQHGRGGPTNGVSPSRRHIAVILVDELDRATVKAIRYAATIEALDVRAVHAAADPVRATALIQAWMEYGAVVQVRLDVEECFDRNIVRSLRRYVGELEDADTRVTLVLPRREFPHRLHLLLHDRTSRAIAHAFTDDEHVDVVVVPYAMATPQATVIREPLGSPAEQESHIDRASRQP